MNLSGIPAIDGHCHPFTADLRQLTEEQMRDIIMFRQEGGSAPQAVDTLTAHQFLRDVSDFLGCDPTFKSVVETRNRLAAVDYAAFTERCFADAGVEALIPDTGYPWWKKVTIDDFAQVVTKRRLYEVFRAESAFTTRSGVYFVDRTLDFDSYIETFRTTLVDAVKNRGCVGLKTVIAYRTGLAVRLVTPTEARAAYAQDLDTDLQAQKTIRDYLFKIIARTAGELGVPMVIHTGFTALTKPWSYGNPTDLSPILTDPDLKDTIFHLLHGGFPWTTAIGYMAANHPNVYVDLSEFNPAASIHIERYLEEIFAFAPLSKLTFGTDGVAIPEWFWYATMLGRRALGNILERFVKERLMRAEKAENYAAQILNGTVRSIYHLAEH